VTARYLRIESFAIMNLETCTKLALVFSDRVLSRLTSNQASTMCTNLYLHLPHCGAARRMRGYFIDGTVPHQLETLIFVRR